MKWFVAKTAYPSPGYANLNFMCGLFRTTKNPIKLQPFYLLKAFVIRINMHTLKSVKYTFQFNSSTIDWSGYRSLQSWWNPPRNSTEKWSTKSALHKPCRRGDETPLWTLLKAFSSQGRVPPWIRTTRNLKQELLFCEAENLILVYQTNYNHIYQKTN